MLWCEDADLSHSSSFWALCCTGANATDLTEQHFCKQEWEPAGKREPCRGSRLCEGGCGLLRRAGAKCFTRGGWVVRAQLALQH